MRNFIIFLLGFGIMISCSKPAELDLPSPDIELVLDARLFIGDSTIVSLNTSYPAFEEDRRVRLDSSSLVLLYENDQLVDQLQRISPNKGIYKSFYNTSPNQTYRVEAMHDGFSPVSGTTNTKDKIGEIISARLIDERDFSELVFTLRDDGSEEDAYSIFIKVDSLPFIERLGLRTSDPTLRTFTYSGIGSFDQEKKQGTEFYLSDAQFNGQEKEFRLIVDDIRWEQIRTSQASLELIVTRVEPIWYEHEKSLFDLAQSFLGIFSEPARIVQNTDGGFGIVCSGKTTTFSL